MVKIVSVTDAVKKLKAVAPTASHGGINVVTAMREASQRTGIKITPETGLDFNFLLEFIGNPDLSEGDWKYLAENMLANCTPELLAVLDIAWQPIP